MKCLQCGHDNPDTALFCNYCKERIMIVKESEVNPRARIKPMILPLSYPWMSYDSNYGL